MFNSFGKIVLIVLLILIGIIISVYLFRSLFSTFSYKRKNKVSFKVALRDSRWPKLFDAFKWVLIDLKRGKDYLRLYGLWAFTGYYGEGKTLGCVLYANKLKEENPHRNIKIYSNIDVKGQEKRITNWEELLDLPPNSIFIYDESQADFGSTNVGVREFPPDLLRKLTQVRKNNLAIFATTPVYTRMNINMRESVHFVVESYNRLKLDRFFTYKFYRADVYERLMDGVDNKLKDHMLFSESFAVTDKDYDLYNSLEEVGTIQKENVEIKGKRNVVELNSRFSDFRNDIIKEVEFMIRKMKARDK